MSQEKILLFKKVNSRIRKVTQKFKIKLQISNKHKNQKKLW